MTRQLEASTLLAIAEALSGTLDFSESLRRVCRELARLTGAETASIHLCDRHGTELRPVAGYHIPRHALPVLGTATLPVAELGFRQRVLEEGRAVWTDDVPHDPRFSFHLFRDFPHQSGVLIPLVLDGKIAGAFYLVWWTQRRAFGEADLATLEAIGRQVGLFLGNVRLHEDTERRRREAESLAEIGRLISRSLQFEEVAQRIVETVSRLLGGTAAVLYRSDPRSGDLVMVAGAGEDVEWNRRLPRGTATVGLAVRERRPVATVDVLADPRIELTPETRGRIERSRYRAVLAIPLSAQDAIVGILAVGDQAGRIFTDEEVRLAQAFADQAATALENARLFQEAEQQRQEADTRAGRLKTLATLTGLVTSSPSSQGVFQAAALAAGTLLDAAIAEVWIAEPTERVFRVAGRYSRDARVEQLRTATIPLGQGLVGCVAETGQPVAVADVQQDPRWLKPELVRELGLHGFVGYPLAGRDTILGVLALLFFEGRALDAAEAELITILADQVAIAIQNAEDFERYRLRFDRNPAGMVVTTADGSVLDANEAFARLLGYSSREEILALNAAGFYADPSAYERIVARLQTGEAVTDLEAELRRCNGDLAWVLMSSYLVRDRRGTRFETTVIDVTDRRRAAEAERRAEALRSVTGLANAAAHEINNPLFIIMANLELLEKEGPASPKVRERIQNVLEAIRRVHEIVERMRRIIRLELAADPSGLPEMLDLGKSAAPDPNA